MNFEYLKGRLAQLGERLPYKQEVIGSSPISPNKVLCINELKSTIFYGAFFVANLMKLCHNCAIKNSEIYVNLWKYADVWCYNLTIKINFLNN